MIPFSLPFNKKRVSTLIHVFFACVSTFYLFYIDEGYFNFKWMQNPGNWIAFVVYVSFFIFMQWIIKQTLLKQIGGFKQVILSSIIACSFLIVAIVILFQE